MMMQKKMNTPIQPRAIGLVHDVSGESLTTMG
jgi:hypothetical protein